MATTGKKVFISPNAFLAFINRADPKHPQAVAFFRYFAQENYRLYVDFLNIYETGRQIHFQISPSLARDFLRTIFITNINVIYPLESRADRKSTRLNSSHQIISYAFFCLK